MEKVLKPTLGFGRKNIKHVFVVGDDFSRDLTTVVVAREKVGKNHKLETNNLENPASKHFPRINQKCHRFLSRHQSPDKGA